MRPEGVDDLIGHRARPPAEDAGHLRDGVEHNALSRERLDEAVRT